MGMKYKKTHSTGNRDPSIRRNYEIFIDVGSYRTTVLCLPKNNEVRKELTHNFLIPFGGEKEFPSSYMKLHKGVRILELTPKTSLLSQDSIVNSAKSDFLENYLDYQTGENEYNKTASFVEFIKALLEHTFRVITSDSDTIISHNIKTSVSEHWYGYKGIPIITGIRITVPDLYIENLRNGYCDYVSLACKKLSSETPNWGLLLSDFIRREQKKPNNQASVSNPFVTISADESGAGELYFLESMKLLSWIKFNQKPLVNDSLHRMKKLFSQQYDEDIAEEDSENQAFRVACCRIDIGGLTTDAGVSTIEFLRTPREKNSQYHVVKYKLVNKESFSKKIAGEIFRQEYQLYQNDENAKEWWNDESFISSNSACSFKNVLEKIISSQYTAISKSENINAIYFVISGRPTMSEIVQEALLKIILRSFNKEELLLFKENCLFMSKYLIISEHPLSNDWCITSNKEFAKWVTTIGCKNILKGNQYTIEKQDFKYHIRLEEEYEKDGMPTISIDGSNVKNLKEFNELSALVREGAESIDLSFSSKEKGEYIKFLNISGSACRAKHSNDLDKSYPKLSIGEVNHQQFPKPWIVPSILVHDLDKEIHSLPWQVPFKWSGNKT